MDLTPRRLLAAAHETVQARLRQRTKVSLANSFATTNPERPRESLENEARQLAAIVGVDMDYLRPDDRLGDILRVEQTELPEDVRPLLRKFGLDHFVRVQAFEILDHVERRMAKDRSILYRPPFVPSPRNEDEWIDRIMNMTVGELLIALA